MQKREKQKQFEEHIREYELLIHKVCRVYTRTDVDSEDLFQEIVIQLWNSFGNFKGEAKPSTWIYQVAINTAITGLRKKKDFITSSETGDLPDKAISEEAGEDKLQDLYKAIEHLNQVEKAIVMLYMEEHTYAEMENILGISQGNLRVKMNRIKEKLRQLLKN